MGRVTRWRQNLFFLFFGGYDISSGNCHTTGQHKKRGKTKKTDQILKTRKRLFLKKNRRAFDEDSTRIPLKKLVCTFRCGMGLNPLVQGVFKGLFDRNKTSFVSPFDVRRCSPHRRPVQEDGSGLVSAYSAVISCEGREVLQRTCFRQVFQRGVV